MAFREPRANIVDLTGCLSQIVLCFLVGWYAERDSISDQEIKMLMLASACIPLLLGFGVLLKTLMMKWDRAHKQRHNREVLERLQFTTKLFSIEDQTLLDNFIDRIGDWDRIYLLHFDAIVRAELMLLRDGKQARVASQSKQGMLKVRKQLETLSSRSLDSSRSPTFARPPTKDSSLVDVVPSGSQSPKFVWTDTPHSNLGPVIEEQRPSEQCATSSKVFDFTVPEEQVREIGPVMTPSLTVTTTRYDVEKLVSEG